MAAFFVAVFCHFCEKSSYIEPNHDIDYYKRTMFDSVTFGKTLKFMVKNND